MKKSKMKNSIYSTLIIVIFIAFAFATGGNDSSSSDHASNSNEESSTTTTPHSFSRANGDFTLKNLDSHLDDAYYLHITGTIRNVSYYDIDYVEINIKLYDSSGNLIGSPMSNITDLNDHEAWKFDVPSLKKNVSKYKVVSIKGRKY